MSKRAPLSQPGQGALTFSANTPRLGKRGVGDARGPGFEAPSSERGISLDCPDSVLCFIRLQHFVVNLVAELHVCVVPASLPFIQPCQPRPAKKPPAGDRWLHQPKLDGWRVQGVKRGGDVALFRYIANAGALGAAA